MTFARLFISTITLILPFSANTLIEYLEQEFGLEKDSFLVRVLNRCGLMNRLCLARLDDLGFQARVGQTLVPWLNNSPSLLRYLGVEVIAPKTAWDKFFLPGDYFLLETLAEHFKALPKRKPFENSESKRRKLTLRFLCFIYLLLMAFFLVLSH